MNISYSRYKTHAERLALAPSRIRLDYDSIAELELERAARVARSREVARLFERGWVWLVRKFRNALGGQAVHRWIAAAQADRGCS